MAREAGNPKSPMRCDGFAGTESSRYGIQYVVTDEEESKDKGAVELRAPSAPSVVGAIPNYERERVESVQGGSSIQNCNESCSPRPCKLSSGVECTDVPPLQEYVDFEHRHGGIRNIIKMRLSEDPLQNVRPREERAISEYDRLMAFIDEVTRAIGCPDPDSDPNWALVSRVCAVSKHLFPSAHSDSINQCVLEEALAICIIERVARAHADGVYTWCGTAWSKVDGQHFVTMSMKTEWEKCIDCASGFFFSMQGKGVPRDWPHIELFMKEQVSEYSHNAQELLEMWDYTRRVSVQNKERVYGVHSSVKFSTNAEWPLQTGVAVSKVCVSAELHLFTRPSTSVHIKRTYESPKIEEPRLCFLDCVLKFNDRGTLVPDIETVSPRKCRFYQFFDFCLLLENETVSDKARASENLQDFFSATWHGNAGAHTAEMMGLTLAFAGREVGRFYILPDRSDSGKTTHDLALCYLLGSSESSGRGSLSGTLHCEWLCDEKALGFEGHTITQCKFTLTPELSTKPILNDLYKRIPTNVTQKLRKPHSDQVFEATFGKCVHFLETNYTPKMQYIGDDLASLVKRSVVIIFSRKRRFTREKSEVDEESGVYLMRSSEELREKVLTPNTRRAFFRYWMNFTKDYPVARCANMLANLESIDLVFGPTHLQDTEEFCREMRSPSIKTETTTTLKEDDGALKQEDSIRSDNEGGESALEIAFNVIKAVHIATATCTHVKEYKLRNLPNYVLEGLKTGSSMKNKRTKIQNFTDALQTCKEGNTIELFRMSEKRGDFMRLDIDIRKFEQLAPSPGVFGTQREWGDVLARRSEKVHPAETHKVHTAPPNEPVLIKEFFDVRGLRSYIPHCTAERAEACYSLLNYATSRETDQGFAEVEVPYSNTAAYGRKYARGASCQKIGREGRKAVFRRCGVDVDICNCHPSLVRQLLIRSFVSEKATWGSVDTMYPMLYLFVENYTHWRRFCCEYFDVGPEKGKEMLHTIVYGGNVRGDVPFLHALRFEMRKAAEYLCGRPNYAHLQEYYDGRRRPLYSMLSAIVSFEEDRTLGEICRIIGRPAICLMYDGAVFECSSRSDLSEIHSACVDVRAELGVSVEIKQWGAPMYDAHGARTRCVWQPCIDSGMAKQMKDSQKHAGGMMCLYNAVRFISVSYCYEEPNLPGPYSVSHYNQNVSTWIKAHGAHVDAFYLSLQDGISVDPDSTCDTDCYICYVQDPSSVAGVGHFVAISISNDTRNVLICDDSLDSTLQMSLSDLVAFIEGMQIYIFRATKEEPMYSHSSWPYAAKGGGAITESFRCSRSDCVQCGEPLSRIGETRAVVYGFHEGREVGHVLYRCSSRPCRTRHWFNYICSAPHKIYFPEDGRRDALFVNSRVGFEVVFLNYIQKLHFFGFVSFSAILRTHASVFKSPTTKHFAKLLRDAFFLLHVDVEFRRAGIQTAGLRIGDELSDESTHAYIDYVRRADLPPPRLQSVTTIVCDGNAKVLTKCGKRENPPKRVGAPRLRTDGSKMSPKPFWNGWFFFIEPHTGRILWATPMRGPENNSLVVGELVKVASAYPYVTCLVYDRACKITRDAKKKGKLLRKIKFYIVDKFHGVNHSARCVANPYVHGKLMKRIHGINTVVAEQIFSWFRNYARTFNELRRNRHHFLVVLYARYHNDLVDRNSTDHLNRYSGRGSKRSTPYECGEDSPAKRQQ